MVAHPDASSIILIASPCCGRTARAQSSWCATFVNVLVVMSLISSPARLPPAVAATSRCACVPELGSACARSLSLPLSQQQAMPYSFSLCPSSPLGRLAGSAPGLCGTLSSSAPGCAGSLLSHSGSRAPAPSAPGRCPPSAHTASPRKRVSGRARYTSLSASLLSPALPQVAESLLQPAGGLPLEG